MIEIKEKCIYFADPGGDLNEELEHIILSLENRDLELKDCEIVDIPPFDKPYDILFFDWGGMSMGNSLLEDFCSYIIEDAEKYPNRCFIMVSHFTELAMKEALLEFEDKKFHNIFLDIRTFAEYYKTYFSE